MNDALIRESFHRKKLRKHHEAPDTLVIDELGLKHGRCRADIAVINGHFIAFEIKSDEDSLRRLTEQVKAYNAVFDQATVIVGRRHIKNVERLIPLWWGITAASAGERGAVRFETIRPAAWNQSTDDFAVAQLLWREEAAGELASRGVYGGILRQKRSVLYYELVKRLGPRELRQVVRVRLKGRTGWRRPARPFRYDD